MKRSLFALLVLGAFQSLRADDLSEYKTVDKAITTRISRSSPAQPTISQPGYLGAHVEANKAGLSIIGVAFDSPAEKAGLKAGDILKAIDGKPVTSSKALRDLLQKRSPGKQIKVALMRGKASEEKAVTLAAFSRPITARSGGFDRPTLGIQIGESAKGILVDQVTPRSGAAEAGLRRGDIIVKIDDRKMDDGDALRGAMRGKRPGDMITVVYLRDKKEQTTKLKLGSAFGRGGRRGGGARGWDTRRRRGAWSKPEYRLAVIPVEFSDVKQNKAIKTKDWEEALFSTGTYNDKSVTGQKVFGSVNDYYQEISYKKFRVTGKVFDYVTVAKKRDHYSASGVSRTTLLSEAVDKLVAREGRDALKNYDGIFFLYAGGRARVARGGLYWPHRATFSHKGQRWAYFICPEGGTRMESISVITHEFGHMLGMPDLYTQAGRTPEGLGVWCTMATGHGRSGRPLHFSAWCKEQLGWIKPIVIDPRTKQKLILSPVSEGENQCVKVLLRPDGSEYLLLENRVKKGFDRDLPGEGLLVWRIIGGRPVLQESHGDTGESGPRRYLDAVPYPSRANNAFTPDTTPSSKRSDSELPVHITNIRRLKDGRITFHIGYEYF